MSGRTDENLLKQKIVLILSLTILSSLLIVTFKSKVEFQETRILQVNPPFPEKYQQILIRNITTLPKIQINKENLTFSSEDNQQKAEYDERAKRVNEVCQANYKEDLNLEFQFGDQILTSFELQLSYCWTPKVGTTTWFNYFMELAQLPEQLEEEWTPWMYMPKVFEIPTSLKYREKRAIFGKTFAIIFVRHPFLRLVSAYKDKVVNHKYYPVQRILTKYKSSSWDKPAIHDGKEVPNFSQFVEFVLDVGHKHDIHIESFSSRCGLCTIPYDFIGKLETFDKDMKYIIKKVGLEEKIPQLIHENTSSGGSTREMAQNYFSVVQRSKIQQLYQMYKKDFDLFDYSPDVYIQLGFTTEAKQ